MNGMIPLWNFNSKALPEAGQFYTGSPSLTVSYHPTAQRTLKLGGSQWPPGTSVHTWVLGRGSVANGSVPTKWKHNRITYGSLAGKSTCDYAWNM